MNDWPADWPLQTRLEVYGLHVAECSKTPKPPQILASAALVMDEARCKINELEREVADLQHTAEVARKILDRKNRYQAAIKAFLEEAKASDFVMTEGTDRLCHALLEDEE